MNKPRTIFIILAFYILTAFGWWGFAHYRSSREIYELQKSVLEISCHKASAIINEEIASDDLSDTVQLNKLFYFNFPKLEIIYLDSFSPLSSFLIRPSEKSYDEIEKKFIRKKWMFASEGIVMISLLFWGIIWVYRNLQQSIKLSRQQNNFLLSITHELKTPITSIKLYLETLLKRNLEKEQQETIIKNSIADSDRLRELVDNLLISAQLENKKFELNKTKINLSQLVNTAIEKFATPRNISEKFVKNIEHEIYLNCDELAIEAVFINLLNNAYKYTAGNIFVLLRSEESKIILSIADEGDGIANEDKDKLFDKFFRSGDENTRKTKGTGLGLFIVKNLLNLHKAQIEVKNNSPKGANFEITFFV